jgi:hypothetical protein
LLFVCLLLTVELLLLLFWRIELEKRKTILVSSLTFKSKKKNYSPSLSVTFLSFISFLNFSRLLIFFIKSFSWLGAGILHKNFKNLMKINKISVFSCTEKNVILTFSKSNPLRKQTISQPKRRIISSTPRSKQLVLFVWVDRYRSQHKMYNTQFFFSFKDIVMRNLRVICVVFL